MPKLSSGLHVGLDPRPLSKFLKEAPQPWNIHKVMALKNVDDLYPYIDIMLFVPEVEANTNGEVLDFADDSLPRPQGLVPVSSGYRLSQWNELAKQWSEEDKAEFESFLSGRATSLFEDGMSMVRKIQELLRNTDDFLTRVLAGWCDAGCHPAQEEGWADSDVGSPTWDDYDMLAALGQVLVSTQTDSDSSESQAIMRLSAFWNLCCRLIAELQDWPDPAAPVRAVAQVARSEGWVERLSESDRLWLHRQAVAECVCLWNALGDDLQRRFPQPYGIVELVVVSGDANEYFDSKASETRPQP